MSPHFVLSMCITEHAVLSSSVIMSVSASLNCEFHEGRDDICFCHCLLRTQYVFVGWITEWRDKWLNEIMTHPLISPTKLGNVTPGIWISYLHIVWGSFVLGPFLVSSLSPNSARNSFFFHRKSWLVWFYLWLLPTPVGFCLSSFIW